MSTQKRERKGKEMGKREGEDKWRRERGGGERERGR